MKFDCCQLIINPLHNLRGEKIARLVPMTAASEAKNRRALMERVRAAAAGKLRMGVDAARSQDFLYGADGLPT